MRSGGIRVVLTLGRPDPDRLSTAALWSLIAHFGLLAAMIGFQFLPGETTKLGQPHFVTLAPGRPAAGGGGGAPRAEPAPPRPQPPKPQPAPPSAPKAVSEPPPPPRTPPSSKASLPSDKPARPAPPAPREVVEASPSEGHEPPSEDAAAGAGSPGAPPGPAGAAAGDAGGVGGTSFGEGDFRYGWYQTAIESKLQSSWRKPAATVGETQTATVSFVILRNGTVKDVRVVTPSGNPTMDLSVMRAVYDANPLPPLPRGWSGDSVHVSMEFSLEPGAP